MCFVITLQFQYFFCSLTCMSVCFGCPMAVFYSSEYINAFKGSLGKYLILGAPKNAMPFMTAFV